MRLGEASWELTVQLGGDVLQKRNPRRLWCSMQKYEVVPDWIMDNELFAEYMENYPVQPEPDPFWKQPFPDSWNTKATPAPVATDGPEKRSSLSSAVGWIGIAIVDIVIWCLR